jgi:hypothetical protein
MKRASILAIAVILTVSMMVLSSTRHAFAATQNVCAGSAVANGWIKINDTWSATQCTPSAYQYNVWTIESYYDKPDRYNMTVCWDPATPSGWVTIDKRYSATLCHEPSATYNTKIIYRVSLADTQLNICDDSPFPSGWLQTNDKYSATTCPSAATYNVWVISRYDNKPVGSTMTVCSDAVTPSGWTVISTSWSATTCGHTSGNVKTIKRVS